MNHIINNIRTLFLFLIIIGIFLANTKTVAISYFDNTSGIEKYNPLSKGLADMLITELSNIESVQIVEREKLQKLIDEINLEQSEFFNPATAQQLGEGLGAEIILTGAFLSIEPEMRIDARLIEVETGKIISASKVRGNSTDIFTMIDQLSELITKELQITASVKTKNIAINIESVINYSKSIDLFDKGLNEMAQELLSATINKNPDFVYAKDYLEKLKKRIDDIQKNRSAIVNAKITAMINNLDANSEKFYSEISNIWMSLMSSPHKMLAFNNELTKLNLNKDGQPYGDASPLTFGELFSFYNIMAHMYLKNHVELMIEAEDFFINYPTSMYYTSIKSNFDMSFKEIEGRKNGKKKILAEMKKARIENSLKFINNYFNRRFITRIDDYNEAKKYYIKNILDINQKDLKEAVSNPYNDRFTYTYGFPEMVNIAASFNDIEFAELLLEKHEEFLLDTEYEEYYYILEESNYYDFENAEKRVIIQNTLKQKSVNYYIENVNNLSYHTLDSVKKAGLDSLYIALLIQQNASIVDDPRKKQNNWNVIFANSQSGLEKFHFFSLWQDAIETYGQDTIIIAADKKAHKKYLRKEKRAYKKNLEEYQQFKSMYSEIADLANMAQIYSTNKQYADEISVRYEILKNHDRSDEEKAKEYRSIMQAYLNLGYFEEANKIFQIIKDKYSTTSTGSYIDVFKRQIYLD